MDRQEEFLTLFLQDQGAVRAFIGSLVRDAHAREDLLQEVALVLWRQFDEFDRSRSFGAWARGIAAKKLLQRWGQAGRWPSPLAPEVVEAVQQAYDRAAEDDTAEAEALRLCLDQLPEKSRSLLALRYERSLKLHQIAEHLHATTDSIHKALSRIRTRLQACVERRVAVAARQAQG